MADVEEQQIDYTKRQVPSVPQPDFSRLSKSQLFLSSDSSSPQFNVSLLKEHLLKEGRVEIDCAIEITRQAAQLFAKEPNLLELKDPVTVVADVHGQFYDVIELFKIAGEPGPKNTYLFLGDYVDRGNFGCEICLLLFAYKILYPQHFYLLRGNHESRLLNEHFNFKKECMYKYNEQVFTEIEDCFDCLPLAAILNKRFFCVHGGISPQLQTVKQINEIHRFVEPPSTGLMCDLIWSDPMEDEQEEELLKQQNEQAPVLFVPNEQRGCSYTYTYRAVTKFLERNNLLSIIRAHEVQDEGYKLFKKSKSTNFPSVISLFSAPNYCDTYGNKAAFITFKDNGMNIKQFLAVQHPYYLPNFMNSLVWSAPFAVDKMLAMFHVMLSLCTPEEDEMDSADEERQKELRAESIRAKIRAVGRMHKMYSTLVQEQESILLLKGLAGGNIPKGLLLKGPEAIRDALADYQQILLLDAENEKRPVNPEIAENVTSPTNLQKIDFDSIKRSWSQKQFEDYSSASNAPSTSVDLVVDTKALNEENPNLVPSPRSNPSSPRSPDTQEK